MGKRDRDFTEIKEKFDLHADDSSDDESEDDLKAKDSFSDLVKKQFKDNSNAKFSFIAHFLGIQLLYCKLTNFYYYQLKKQLLVSRHSENFITVISKAFKDAINDVYPHILSFIEIQKNKKSVNDIKLEIYTSIIQDFESKNKTLLTTVLKDLRSCYVDYKPSANNQVIIEKLKKIIQSIASRFCKYFNKNLDEKISGFLDSGTIMLCDPLELKKAKKIDIKPIVTEAKEKSIQLLESLKVDLTKRGKSGLKAAIAILKSTEEQEEDEKDEGEDDEDDEKNTRFTTLKLKIISTLETNLNIKAPTTRSIENFLREEVDFQELTKAYIADVVEIEDKEEELDFWEETVCLADVTSEENSIQIFKKGIFRFLKMEKAKLLAIISHIFEKIIYKNLNSILAEETDSKNYSIPLWMSDIYRKNLGDFCIISSKNAYGFFAGLRLSNRSQTRMIKNLQDSDFKIDFVATRLWRLINDDKISPSVSELQLINTKCGREDKVLGLETYTKIHEEVGKLKKIFDLTDVIIAESVRQILQGKKPNFIDDENYQSLSSVNKDQIFQALSSITYLLFGCEVTRNPSMVIVNQMLIDLIIDKVKIKDFGIITWNNALPRKEKEEDEDEDEESKITVPGLMPMCPTNAISIARQLNSLYGEYMPHFYKYPGSSRPSSNKKKIEADPGKYISTIEQLIDRESTILCTWLRWKKPDYKKMSIPLIETTIKSSFEEWFGKPPKHIGEGHNHVSVSFSK